MSITIGLASGERITLDKDVALVGMDDHCDVRSPGWEGINARHARIKKVGGRWLIESLGEWPLRVDDEEPARACWLRPGDVVQLAPRGPSIIFEPLPASRPAALAVAPRPVVRADRGGTETVLQEARAEPAAAARSNASALRAAVWGLLGLLVVGGYLSYKGHTLRDLIPDLANHRAEMLAFRDDASAFAGRTLTGEMYCESAKDGLADMLRARPPGVVLLQFRARTSAGYFPIQLRVSTTLKTPNAAAWDPLLVTFRCDEGNPVTGNVALAIRRK